VSHDYASAGSYDVTLTAEDSAGALSTPKTVRVTVAGTPPQGPVTPPADTDPGQPVVPAPGAQRSASAINLSAEVKGKRISADGRVEPTPAGGQVQLELLRKRGHDFVSVKSTSASLASGAFTAGLKNPKHTRKCELVATFTGDTTLLPSEATDKFRC
jgi:PKD repeat protein